MATSMHRPGPTKETEYLCECAGYTETRLRRVILRRRLRSISAVRRETGVGKCCNACRDAVEKLLSEIWGLKR